MWSPGKCSRLRARTHEAMCGSPLSSWRRAEVARVRETQEAFAAPYRRRAGIEGTLSQGVRTMHLRRARYIGLAKVHLQHGLTAAALNLVRVAAWLAGTPRARASQPSSGSWHTQPEPAEFASSISRG